MATTHAFVGLAFAGVYAVLGGDYATAAAIGAIAGGVFPDLDMLAEHRKTLHYPEYYAVGAVVSVLAAVVVGTAVAVGIGAFMVSAAVHAASDVLGGGLEARPWLAESNRAVFFHRRGTWARPRRYIRYDGAPEDLAVGVAFAIPGYLAFDGWIRELVLVGVLLSGVYVLLRKRLPRFEERYLQ